MIKPILQSLMYWINNYQLFLFDFDGLLVNTEELHYDAYKQMLAGQGIAFDWSFEKYCQSAHYASEKFREEILEQYPLLKNTPWEKLYQEKQRMIQEALRNGSVHLMPGVEELLTELQKRGLKHAVVTHSPDQLVSIVRKQHPVLDQIPFWITRHDYQHPKPNPECYALAIERHASPDEQVIGFEDTPRGLNALLGTRAKPVLITKVPYPEIPFFKEKGVPHFQTFTDIAL